MPPDLPLENANKIGKYILTIFSVLSLVARIARVEGFGVGSEREPRLKNFTVAELHDAMAHVGK